jgi:hypothetical protein
MRSFTGSDGPDGPAAVMGSANCSAAAWIRPPASGGNIEAVVVYDRPDASDFAPILSFFDSPDLVSAELKPARIVQPELPASEIDPTISEIVWDESLGEMRVSFSAAPSIESVIIMTGDESLSLHPVSQDGLAWAAELLSSFDKGLSAFVLVEVRFDGGRVSRLRSWVNHLSELRHAARGRRIADTLVALTMNQSPGEQQRIVDDLHGIALALANEPDSFPDASLSTHEQDTTQPADEPDAWQAINPEAFVVSINDLRQTERAQSEEHATPALSLSGVLRALFGVAGPTEVDDEAEYSSDPEINDDQADEEDAGASVTDDAPPALFRAPEPQNSARLVRSMEQLISGMSSEKFAANCTVTQLVQAAAYPLAVATLGRRGGGSMI